MIDLRHLALLANLELSAEEYELFPTQLEVILAHVEVLMDVDVSQVPPLVQAFEEYDAVREDVPRPGLSQEDALRNAPSVSDGLFRVPKMIADA